MLKLDTLLRFRRKISFKVPDAALDILLFEIGLIAVERLLERLNALLNKLFFNRNLLSPDISGFLKFLAYGFFTGAYDGLSVIPDFKSVNLSFSFILNRLDAITDSVEERFIGLRIDLRFGFSRCDAILLGRVQQFLVVCKTLRGLLCRFHLGVNNTEGVAVLFESYGDFIDIFFCFIKGRNSVAIFHDIAFARVVTRSSQCRVFVKHLVQGFQVLDAAFDVIAGVFGFNLEPIGCTSHELHDADCAFIRSQQFARFLDLREITFNLSDRQGPGCANAIFIGFVEYDSSNFFLGV